MDRAKEMSLWLLLGIFGLLGALVRIARDERDLKLWPSIRIVVMGIAAAFLVDGFVVVHLDLGSRVSIPLYIAAGFLASEIFEALILRVRRDGLSGLLRELKRKE